MSNFDNDSYVGVHERLAQFRQDNPEGCIHTTRTGEDDGIYFTCQVFRNSKEVELYATSKIAAATGHAYLDDMDRSEAKVEEFCETVAIGRALACLGYGVTKSIASKEEMDLYNKRYKNGDETEEEDEAEEEPETKVRARRGRSVSSKSNTDKTSKKAKGRSAKKDSEETEEESEEPALKSRRTYNRKSRLSNK